MNRRALRSIAAILSGWLVTVVGYIVTMVIIALFNPETFKTSAHYSRGYWLVTLFVGLIYSIVGGFITGIVARRREVAHAIGLVVFGLLISECWPRGDQNTMSVPGWYWIAGYVLVAPSTILGGWLRARQGVLLAKIPPSVTATVDNVRLSIAITIDHSRPLIATLLALVTFVTVLFGAMPLGLLVLMVVLERLFGREYHPPIAFPVFIASIILASILSRRIFRRIMSRDASLMDDRGQE